MQDILSGWLEHFIDEIIVGACIFASVVVAALVPSSSTARKHVLLFTAILLGALAGEAILMARLPPSPGVSIAAVLFAKVARWLAVAGPAYLFFIFQRQAAAAAAQMHANELQRVELERQLTEAQLHSLRAQIEPHFLFNTLANVQGLYRTEPQRGRRMLGSFIAYLRGALPQMRRHETTLKQEVDLAQAYLDVLRVRMGERLKVRFDVPQELAALPFPPLALSTLTENAVKHGLNPLPEGGAIEMTARIEDRQLKVGHRIAFRHAAYDAGRGNEQRPQRAKPEGRKGRRGMAAHQVGEQRRNERAGRARSGRDTLPARSTAGRNVFDGR